MKVQEQLKEEINNYDSSNELIKRHEIKDSPFVVISTEGKVFGTMGQYRITEPRTYDIHDQEERNFQITECENEIKKITWNRLVQVMLILLESRQRIEKEISNVLKEDKE